MRFGWVGFILVLFSSVLLAQVEGEVESIGFGTYYRPECWVPMRVALRPTSDSAAEVQIRVIQEDLDHDRVVATRTVTVTPDINGRNDKQTFWMYFRPQASGSGLKDTSLMGANSKDLQAQLKVLLVSGGKTLASPPLTQLTLRRVDLDPAGGMGGNGELKGVRVVLCVTDGRSLPAFGEYGPTTVGLTEQPLLVPIRPEELPEDVRAYEMVDAILWMGANAPDPARGSEQPRYRAIEEYVRQGGSLVVVQSPEMAQTRGFNALLPVAVLEARETKGLEPLLEMARLGEEFAPAAAEQTRRVAFAKAKPDALVIRQKQWGKETSPFLARIRVGAGCVTWVAQDLGEPALVRALRSHWPRLWDEVMGWRNNSTPLTQKEAEGVQNGQLTAYTPERGKTELGAAFRRAGQLGSRAAGYVLVAVVFFLAYWVLAGPGLYAWLSMKKMATLNWFLFGVAAVGAAGLAMLMVKFVQTGQPELDHVTIVKAPAGEPAVMQSHVSLLIRDDGLQRISLPAGQPHAVHWVTPYPEHPYNNHDSGKFLAMQQYDLPIQDAANDEPVNVEIPWRNTSKRLQVKWTGELAGRIEGQVRLTGRALPELEGPLTNGTGMDLHEIYLVWRPAEALGDGGNGTGDRVLFIPKWPKGDTIQTANLFSNGDFKYIGRDELQREATPRSGKIVFGRIEMVHRGFGTNEVAPGEGWAGYWYSGTRGSAYNIDPLNDAGSNYDTSLPLCSLYQRVPPMRNSRDNSQWEQDRRSMLRVGARWMDASPAVASGSLLILAQGHGPIPIPLSANGDELKGNGLVIYQFMLPLARSMGVEK